MSTTPQFLRDGFKTLVSFGTDPQIRLWNKDMQPPSIEGGGEIDVTTMLNTAWRTKVPKSLKSAGNASFQAAYSPQAYTDIIAAINVNQLITVTFPDTATLAFYGWLNSFKPGKLEEGKQPTADVEIIVSNLNGTTETGPSLTPGTFGLKYRLPIKGTLKTLPLAVRRATAAAEAKKAATATPTLPTKA